MRGRRGFIILVLIAAGIIFGAPILISVVRESSQPIDAPTVTPRSATITPEGGTWDCSRRMACGDFANFDLLRGYALACPAEAAALDGDGDGEICEPVR